MKTLSILAFACCLAACSTSVPVVQKAQDYDAQTQARVRLFGQNQKPTMMTVGMDCATNSKGEKINIGGGLGDAFGSFVGTVKSESIGIAPTKTTALLGERNGILSRAFFREFVVPAGKPVNVQAAYLGLSAEHMGGYYYEGSCQSEVGSFVPEAGKDYEVIGARGKACAVYVAEVSASGEIKPIAVEQSFRCP